MPSNKNGILLCFVGVDGSGKTTHAKHIVDFLRKRGYLSKYVRVASRPVFLYPFLILTRIMGFWKSVKKGAWTDPLDKASPTIKAELGKVYRFLLFVDFVIITFVKVRLPLRFGRVLICDRYVYDLIMELALSDLYSEVFAKLIFTTSPHPQRVFFADAPIEVIGRRRPELTKDHIYRKQDFYRKLAKIFEFWTFDTSEPFESNQLHLQKEIFLLLEGVS